MFDRRYFVLGVVFTLCNFEGHRGDPAENSEDMGVEFCDGGRHKHLTKENCPKGLRFGFEEPQCLCIKGIYRIFLKNCEIADGFAMDVCMLPYEETIVENADSKTPPITTTVRIDAIEFLREPSDWSLTHLVVETKGSDGQWDLFPIDFDKEQLIQSSADDFYVINGVAKISELVTNSTESRRICVEEPPLNLRGLQNPNSICKFTRKINEGLWHEGDYEFVIRPFCTGPGVVDGRIYKNLNHQHCFKPLTPNDNECQMDCKRPKKFDRNSSIKNCSETVRTILYENEYLERQMCQQALLTQQLSLPSLVGAQEPNRTFELFRLMVEATIRFCPDTFVPANWFNLLIELFYTLHKGREFKYVETISEDEFKFTKKILDECLSKGYQVKLTNRMNNTAENHMCKHSEAGGKALGYCTEKDENCASPIAMDAIREKMGSRLHEMHYVPEVAWNVIEATQAICFREFSSSYRMFHVLQQATEKLFTKNIKNLWYYPPYLDEKTLAKKNRLVGRGADEIIDNLEICIASAYHIINTETVARNGPKSELLRRLSRPSLDKRFRRRKRSQIQSSKQEPVRPNLLPGCTNKAIDFSEECRDKSRVTSTLQETLNSQKKPEIEENKSNSQACQSQLDCPSCTGRYSLCESICSGSPKVCSCQCGTTKCQVDNCQCEPTCHKICHEGICSCKCAEFRNESSSKSINENNNQNILKSPSLADVKPDNTKWKPLTYDD